jgi:hypothetical protein
VTAAVRRPVTVGPSSTKRSAPVVASYALTWPRIVGSPRGVARAYVHELVACQIARAGRHRQHHAACLQRHDQAFGADDFARRVVGDGLRERGEQRRVVEQGGRFGGVERGIGLAAVMVWVGMVVKSVGACCACCSRRPVRRAAIAIVDRIYTNLAASASWKVGISLNLVLISVQMGRCTCRRRCRSGIVRTRSRPRPAQGRSRR